MKRVAVIGAGIVGSTAAYYLSKSPDVKVTVFDDGKGQATKAAAGIQTDFYQQTGVYLLKKDESKLQELYDLAANRREESPLIGDLSLLGRQEAQEKFPGL